jgi:hypothetical protein
MFYKSITLCHHIDMEKLELFSAVCSIPARQFLLWKTVQKGGKLFVVCGVLLAAHNLKPRNGKADEQQVNQRSSIS